MRKVIAERLHASTYNVPHYYLTYKLRVDKLLKLREEINRDRTEKISLNDLFIKAVAKTSRLVPESRSFWDPENNRIRVSDSVDISFAVDTGSGLITPIVKGADKKSLSAVNKTTKGLIEKAKNNKLAPAEYIVVYTQPRAARCRLATWECSESSSSQRSSTLLRVAFWRSPLPTAS